MPTSTIALLMALGAGVLAVVYAAYLIFKINGMSSGNDRMREIAGYIQEGAEAFLKRQYTTIGLLALDGTMVNVGAPPQALPIHVFSLFGNRRSFAGSGRRSLRSS